MGKMEKFSLALRTIKKIVVLLLLILVITLLWIFLKEAGVIFLLIILTYGIFISYYRKDRSLPYLGLFFQNQYFRTKFRITVLKNNLADKDNFSLPQISTEDPQEKHKFIFLRKFLTYAAIFLNSCYLNFLYFLILISKNSHESFNILREDVGRTYGKIVKINLSDNKRKWTDLENLSKKVKADDIRDTDLLQKLVRALYEFHKKDREKAAVFSIASLSIIIMATVINSLISSLIFSTTFNSLAATYTWVQTDWSVETANIALHPTNQSNWSEFSTKDSNISASSSVMIATSSASSLQTSDTDFGAGTFSQTEVSGSGSAANIILDQELGGDISVISVSMGNTHACAVTSYGNLYCWGTNDYGQLGINNIQNKSTPVRVLKGEAAQGDTDGTFLTNVKYVEAGWAFTCAVSNNDNIYCWGKNNFGQLGDNSTNQRNTPVRVLKGNAADGDNDGTYLTNVKSFDARNNHTCAVSNNHNLYCWGSNDNGQLGDNSILEKHTPIRVVKGAAVAGDNDGTYLNNIDSITLGGLHSCAISNGDNLYCWGDNANGQLGDNTIDDRRTPVRVLKGATAAEDNDGTYVINANAMGLGYYHSCFSSVTGNIYCWGFNNNGRLGDNTTNERHTPVRVLKGQSIAGENDGLNLINIRSISSIYHSTCAVSNNDNIYCWGSNNSGQIGDGTTDIDRYTPMRVLKGGAAAEDNNGTNLTNIKSSHGGSYSVCAVSDSYNIYCWGSNSNYQLGDGTATERPTPIKVHGVDNVGYLSLFDSSFVYFSSGTFTSSSVDNGLNNQAWGSVSWSATMPAGTQIVLKAKSSDTTTIENVDACSAIVTINSDNASSSASLVNGCIIVGHRYIKYHLDISTSDTSQTPTLAYVNLGYNYYTNGALTSSSFNTSNAEGLLGKIQWTESNPLPSGTDIKFQLRTSSDGVSWTDWLGPTNSGDYYTSPTGTETIHADHRTGSNDQYFQYKAFLTSTGQYSPVLSDITLSYVFNALPEIQNITASQGNNGTVSISYEVKDTDALSGSVTPGYITPSFQYWNGSTWTTCTTVAAGDTANKAVNQDSFTSYSATWTATTDYLTHFMDHTAKIKVIINDNEPANNIASSTSSTFILDTKAPISPSIKVIASTTPATLTLSATDDSSMQMKISLNSDLASASWQDYAISSNITLATDPDIVYAQFKDAYANTTSIINVTTPQTPSNFMIQDVSNLNSSPASYRLFVAWKTVEEPAPGFKKYTIFRSLDNETYAFLASISERSTNYYMDATVSYDTVYYYKVTAEDDNDNASYLSSATQGKANGAQDSGEGGGGSETTAPTISNVATSSVVTTQATVTWDTNELSNSTVGYSTNAGVFTTETGVATMLDNASGVGAHSVILTDLIPATTYYFKVISTDPTGNIASSTPNADGYMLTTLSGPSITSVSASEIKNTQAIITWNTNEAANSYVIYSTNANLTGPTEVGSATDVTAHSISLTGLTTGTKYYYYVRSGVAQNNNGGAYYNFTTTADTAGPIITGISANLVIDTSTMITWVTDEEATSKVDYGLTSGGYTLSTTLTTNLDMTHSVKLSSLTANTKYYYIVVSRDGSNNTSTSTEHDFTTLEALSTETQVEEREEAAKAEGMTEGEISGRSNAGGGILIIDKTDKTAPIISNIKVSEIKYDSVKIIWETNEDSYSFLDYGDTNSYGMVAGDYDLAVKHEIMLKYLEPTSSYHYRVAAVDSYGNLSLSSDQNFSTPAKTEEEIQKEEIEKGQKKEEEQKTEQEQAKEKLFKDIEALTDPQKGLSKEEIIVNAASAAQKALEIINGLSSQVSLNTLEPTMLQQYNSFQEIGNIIPPPLMSGTPSVITTATTAIIAWKTDKESNSLVALSPETTFNINRSKENPYLETRGNSNEKTKEHVVTIYELKPDTVYHYQVSSQANIGPIAKSSDFTFKTKTETLEISNYAVQNVSNEKAIFRWVTNLETDSELKYIPYRDNKLMVEETKTLSDKALSIIHEITVEDFEAGVLYSVQLAGKDLKGQIITKEIPIYSTSKDDLPPIIYQVQTESAISPGKEEKIQAIISWLTNEPATSRVYYAKGINEQDQTFAEASPLDNAFIKKHVVIITKFDPGMVYSFKVESIDSGGNVSLSKIYTILTPRQKESVFQVIIKNLEQTFGWMSKIRQ